MCEDDGSFVRRVHPGLLDHFEGLFEDALFGGSSFVVEDGELVGEVGGVLSSCGGHEVECVPGVSEATDRVESWRESESYGFGIDLVFVETRCFDEGAESDDGG